MRRSGLDVWILAAAFLLQCQGMALGQMVEIGFSSGTATVGTQITLMGSISAMPDMPVLTGYNFPIDFGNDGFGLPVGISFATAEGLAAEFSNFSFAQTPSLPFNHDLVVSDSGVPGVQLGMGPVDLFSVTLAIAPSFPPGTFQVAFTTAPLPNAQAIALTLDSETTNSVDSAVAGTVTARALLLGDVNLDGVVNLLDVSPFVDRITTNEYQIEADVDQNDFVNLLDVGPFVTLLTNP